MASFPQKLYPASANLVYCCQLAIQMRPKIFNVALNNPIEVAGSKDYTRLFQFFKYQKPYLPRRTSLYDEKEIEHYPLFLNLLRIASKRILLDCPVF